MSAKWRRSKKHLKRFDLFKTLKKVENKNTYQPSHVRKPHVKSHTRSYKYTLPKIHEKRAWREAEPLIDVFEEKDDIIVIAEFAGFSKEGLKIHLKNQRLTLSAEASNQKYHKSLNLPAVVIPKSIRTTYKNGVLEIRLKKAREEKAVDKLAGLENAA